MKRYRRTLLKISLILLGTVFCETMAVAQIKKQTATPFDQRLKENVLRYKTKVRMDSIGEVNEQTALIDSLKAAGMPVPKEILTKQGVGNARTKVASQPGAPVTIQAVAPANLGFENNLAGWTGEFTYNLKKITRVNYRRSIPAPLNTSGEIDQSGVLTYPDIVPGFPSGVPSLFDLMPWAQNIPPQLVTQPARIKVIEDKNFVDPYGGFQVVPDFVGNKVCRIGNNTVGYYKDGYVNGIFPTLYERESMSHTFIVDANNPYIVVNHAEVLSDPAAMEGNPAFPNYTPHTGQDKTFFKVTLQKADNTFLTCASYEVYAISKANSVIPGFIVSDVLWEYSDPQLTFKQILYKPWSKTIINLKDYAGQQVTLNFSTGDCLSGGHWGYAYVDAYATNEGISTAANAVEKNTFCAGEIINFSSFGTGQYSAETVQWNFGDAAQTTSSLVAPNFSYATAGTYTVTLNINPNVAGLNPPCPIQKTITILPPVDARFTINDQTPAPGQTLTLTVTNFVSGSTNQVNWGDNTTSTFTTASATHVYSKSGLYTVTLVTTKTGSCTASGTQTLEVMYLCASDLPSAKNGTFLMDKVTGNIVYSRAGCSAQALMPCVIGQYSGTAKVVNADAIVYSDNWPYKAVYSDNSGTSFSPNADPFETGERGKWRMKSSYSHNTALVPEDKNFRAGTFVLQNFNWKKDGINNNKAKWLLSAEVTTYSPNGDALSEKNILGIESAAKFGYKNAVPYLTAKNAAYPSVLFESFEMVYANTMLEDKMKKPTVGSLDDIRKDNFNFSHSGYSSWRLPTGGQVDVSEFKLSAAQMSKGISVKVWLKQTNVGSYSKLLTNTIFFVKVRDQNIPAIPLKVVSRTGNWILCEATVTSFGTTLPDRPFTLTLQYTLSETIWLDDIRVQPTDAEMNCYVYDRDNLKLLAVFDDQHFGLYYQYNKEGKLIRKMKETERGVKTIQETQYNTNLR